MSETTEQININGQYVNNNKWLTCELENGDHAWAHDLNSPINSLIRAEDRTVKGKLFKGRYQCEILVQRSFVDKLFQAEIMPMAVKAKRPVESLIGEYHLIPQPGVEGRKLQLNEVMSYPAEQVVRVGYTSLRHGSELAKVDPRWQRFTPYSVMRFVRYPKQGTPDIHVADQTSGKWRLLDPTNPTDQDIYRKTFVPGVGLEFSYKVFFSGDYLMFSISKIYAQVNANRLIAPAYEGGEGFVDNTKAPNIVNAQAPISPAA